MKPLNRLEDVSLGQRFTIRDCGEHRIFFRIEPFRGNIDHEYHFAEEYENGNKHRFWRMSEIKGCDFEPIKE